MEEQIKHILQDLNFKPCLLGYKYAKIALLLCLKDKNKLRGTTKGLYFEIAKNYNTTPNRVERAIRHCIETSNAKENLIKYSGFDFTLDGKEKPTNNQLLAGIVEYIGENREENVYE